MGRIPGPNTMWAMLAATVAAYEVWTLRNDVEGDTLSETTRFIFRVHTRPGRAAFALSWVWFGCWFLDHILDPTKSSPSSGLRARQ